MEAHRGCWTKRTQTHIWPFSTSNACVMLGSHSRRWCVAIPNTDDGNSVYFNYLICRFDSFHRPADGHSSSRRLTSLTTLPRWASTSIWFCRNSPRTWRTPTFWSSSASFASWDYSSWRDTRPAWRFSFRRSGRRPRSWRCSFSSSFWASLSSPVSFTTRSASRRIRTTTSTAFRWDSGGRWSPWRRSATATWRRRPTSGCSWAPCVRWLVCWR